MKVLARKSVLSRPSLFDPPSELMRALVLDSELPDDDAIWAAAAHSIVAERLASFAYRKMQELGKAETAAGRTLHIAAKAELLRSMQVVAAGSTAIEALASKSIPHLIIKGPSIARHYRVCSDRPFTDLDILVPVHMHDLALDAVSSIGYADPHRLQVRNYFNRSCRDSINMVHTNGSTIDLHRVVSPWAWGRRMTFDAMLERTTIESLGDIKAVFASAADNLYVAALHMVGDHSRPGAHLRIWRDICVLRSVVQPDDLNRLAAENRLGWWLHALLGHVTATESHLSDQHSPGFGDEVRLRVLLSRWAHHESSLHYGMRLPVKNAALYYIGRAFPSKEAQELLGNRTLLKKWQRFLPAQRNLSS